ncbi:pentatricopeptide repeat protein [Stachybotrys elegans]|uniref:Pentatricopeptide repeat protein n=1 Tax=Stachybotrys elegans TaxID=80388 RepID=A0A8K0WQ35_9HYPO|nr:pentatricopeptide repeat protein [Stachybotrys elegans]
MRGHMLSHAGAVRRIAYSNLTHAKLLATARPPLSFTPSLLQSRRCFATSATAVRSDAPTQLVVKDPAKERRKIERTVEKTLTYLTDPWTLGKRVEDTLRRDQWDEALLLTQRATKSMDTIVAWNHLISYQMDQGRLKRAIQCYNELKKRGQLPNSQTYTIIFSGCAKNAHSEQAVAVATKHYNILLNDSRLTPNTIHLNAVLNVCAKAGDLDSMFLTVNSINDATRSPTSWTYTIIINALRHYALKELKDLPAEQHADNIAKVIGRAKGIWTEVINRWRAGKLVLDEELVCAMGRILLLAPGRVQKQEVLDLLQQAMDIPNLAKGQRIKRRKDDQEQEKTAPKVPASAARLNTTYVTPGKNTLALVLKALASLRLTTLGHEYWNLLVKEYDIVPDDDNWQRLFAMLRIGKASTDIASLVDVVPDHSISPELYRFAMETCIRDNINPNAIKNSNVIVDSMMKRLEIPDLMTLRLYLRVAMCSHFHLRAEARDGNADAAKQKYGLQIGAALAKLWDPYKQLHYKYFKATVAYNDKQRGIQYNNQREVIALARLMFGAFNKVLNEKMLPEKDMASMRPIGAKINREIVKFFAEREEREPALKKLGSNSDIKDAQNIEARIRGIDPTMQDADASIAGYESTSRPSADFVWDTTKPVGPSTSRRYRIEREEI